MTGSNPEVQSLPIRTPELPITASQRWYVLQAAGVIATQAVKLTYPDLVAFEAQTEGPHAAAN